MLPDEIRRPQSRFSRAAAGILGSHDAPEPLLELLADEDTTQKRAVLLGLFHQSSHELTTARHRAVQNAVMPFAEDPDPEVRTLVLQILVTLETNPPVDD